ncbi:conserved Plasmodium protein, unknown function [Plasmodium reichenowi]|uniref:Uncharacterized protein n=1 Tax=Plasmodium reichenowi TaxID=5854 RepID=A0A2P9DFN4_PLARE|nr:conserved Plasmodium protein, unknown function [Plasmodium reichenowi]
MELIIKKPYIEIFEKILKLFTHICENVHFKLTRNKLELSGSNNLTNELVIHIDKKFFILNDVNGDKKNIINGTVKSKDFYNCIYNHKIVKHLRSTYSQHGSYNSHKKDDMNEEARINNINNDEIKSIVCDGMYPDDNNKSYFRKDKKWNIHLSKITLKFNNINNNNMNHNNIHNINHNNNNNNNTDGDGHDDSANAHSDGHDDNNNNNKLEIIIKFKKYNTYFSAILKLKTFNTPMKNYIYKNESIIQLDPTLFLLNLKDLSNEKNIFLKNTDNSFIISSLETCDFSLNKERIKREQFFYNNKNICIPSSKTKYFFKNKKFQDHNMSLPLNELKTIIKFCSDLNLLCLFSTKNFKENLIIYFGNIISYILEKNKNKIKKKKINKNKTFQHKQDIYMMNTNHVKHLSNISRDYKYDYTFDSSRKSHISRNKIHDDDDYINSNLYISSKRELNNNDSHIYDNKNNYDNNNKSIVFYLSDYTSSDEYDSSMDEFDDQIYLPVYDNEYTKGDTNFNYNHIITGCVHFTSYFNISCDFNEYENDKKYEHEDVFQQPMDAFVINNNNNNNNNDNNHFDDSKKVKKIHHKEKKSSIEKKKEDIIYDNTKNCGFNYESNNLRNIREEGKEEEKKKKNSSISEDIDKDNNYHVMQNIKNKDIHYDTKGDSFSDTYGMFNHLKENKSYEDNRRKKHHVVLINEDQKCEESEYDQNGECSHVPKDDCSYGPKYDCSYGPKDDCSYDPNNNIDTIFSNLVQEQEKEIIYNSNIYEEFNYDTYMRQNEETPNVYKNMQEKIKKLDITLENLKKINKRKKKILNYPKNDVKKPFLVFSLPKSRKFKKRRKPIEHISEVHKRNKRSSKDLLYNDVENKRYDNNSVSCRSEENEITSDNFYSLNDDNEEDDNNYDEEDNNNYDEEDDNNYDEENDNNYDEENDNNYDEENDNYYDDDNNNYYDDDNNNYYDEEDDNYYDGHNNNHYDEEDDNYYDGHNNNHYDNFPGETYYNIRHNKHGVGENMEYMNYFNNIYDKYNMYNKRNKEKIHHIKNKKYKNQLNYRNYYMSEKDKNIQYMKGGNEKNENDEKFYNNYKHFNKSRLSHNIHDKAPPTNQYSGPKNTRLIVKNYSSHILTDEIKRRSVNYDNDIFNYKKCKLQKKS